MKYDLLAEPWIPVVRADGSRAELNLIEVLTNAHQWRAIADPLPTVEFGLYRLLVALVLDIFDPEDSADWQELWNKKSFDEHKIKAYFQKHTDAFDLFSDTKPFLQSAGMAGEKPKPLSGLLPPIPSGTGANHFHHADEADFAVSPAAAACLLVTIAPFMTAGGAGLSPSINGAPPWYVLPVGENGFQTLLLNCPVMPDLLLAQGDEGPSWRSVKPITNARAEAASLLESLTWRPRRIQLVPDAKGGRCSLTGKMAPLVVRAMKFAPGFGAGFAWTDPNTAYRIAGDERNVVRPREGREVWRDTGPLAILRATQKQGEKAKFVFERPAIISQIAELGKNDPLLGQHPLDLVIYGLRTDMKMKVFEWHRDHLSVPFTLLWEDLGAEAAQEAMRVAEDVAYQVRRAVKINYPRGAAGNDKGFDALANGASSLFWRELRPEYENFLRLLATSGVNRVEEHQKWRYCARDAGWKALRFAIEDLDSDAGALERQTLAYKAFGQALFPIIEPQKAHEAREKKQARQKPTAPSHAANEEENSLETAPNQLSLL